MQSDSHPLEGMLFSPDVFLTGSIGISQARSNYDKSKWWRKKWSQLINLFRHSGKMGTRHASIYNFCCQEPLRVAWLFSFLIITFCCKVWDLNLILVWDLGGKKNKKKTKNARGRRGLQPLLQLVSVEVATLKLFHLRLKFHPGNCPVNPCLCSGIPVKACNLFCSAWWPKITCLCPFSLSIMTEFIIPCLGSVAEVVKVR